MLLRKSHNSGGGNGKWFTCKPIPPKNLHEGAGAEKPRSSQKMEKDSHEAARSLAHGQEVAAGAAVKQTLEIREASNGTYIRFPNMAKKFSVKPSVVQKSPFKLDLDAQLSSKPGLTLQMMT